jgi:purine/pyrimidine-nucleoside phosphorylase
LASPYKALVKLQGGSAAVLLPGSSNWKTIGGGGGFEVAADAEFDIRALSITDYRCSYFD